MPTVSKWQKETREQTSALIEKLDGWKASDLFQCSTIKPRPMPKDRKSLEPAWADYREGRIYEK